MSNNDSYLDLSELNSDNIKWLEDNEIRLNLSNNKNPDFVGITLDKKMIENNSEELFNSLKNGLKTANKVFAVSTTERKSSGLRKFLQNTLGMNAVPAAPGLFYFFKEKGLEEFFFFKIHDSNSKNIKEDLLVYLALARLKNENILKSLPQYLKEKILLHFGNNIRAISESRKLLQGLGDRGLFPV